jgi:hypothetical protein
MTIKEKVIDYINSNDVSDLSNGKLAIKLNKELNLEYENLDTLRRNLTNWREQTQQTATNQYKNDKLVFSCIDTDGTSMDMDRYCELYNLPRKDVRSYKRVTSGSGIPYYNIAFYEQVEGVDNEELKQIIEKFAKKFKAYKHDLKGDKIAVIKISDIHFGSLVTQLIKTKDYSTNKVAELLQKIAAKVNSYGYDEVHIHLLGDLIESFTGLNHKNSWKNIEHNLIGAEVVKMCVSSLHLNLLSQIKNLSTVKIIAGNHDRLTSGKDEDTEGGAANLISWGLSLIGYDTEFSPSVLLHEVDNISHILLHGHHVISKRSTQQICWDYGVQGKFNLITEGHLHSYIEKASSKLNFNSIKDDGLDHLRMVCRSLYTGNSFSEYLGYYSLSGFHIITNNGEDKPNINNIIL